ncbi:MAG TPA: 1-(5-phosphoribosyl)-5-[(5-phosphoribosylamino)methylideneamino] imidazole-4-carboxamide isomerase [Nitrososphaeraceae archaeon]|nr:1-(5-phosphoribosyl)-5-[(5-phosphoribosylamino)methylideneamino] imidazole-4-carboxamide isomerase [Nitrososphaeraceae archaeon]
MNIIPAIDILEGQVVRLVKGKLQNKIVYSDNPIEIAKKLEAQGAEIIHVVDLDATLTTGWNNNKNNTEIILKIIDTIKIPVQVAGGIRSIDAIKKMFEKKAEKIVIGTLAYKHPQVLQQLSKDRMEKIVISIDQNKGIVMIDGWRQPSGFRIIEAIKFFMAKGVKEFLLTTVDRDGTLNGPDLNTLSYASNVNGAKIIASGGISSIEDIIRIKNIGCSAVILGKSIYDGKIDVKKAIAII